MTHRQPLPRWFWPVVIVCAVWIAVMAIWFPLERPEAQTTKHVHHEGCDH